LLEVLDRHSPGDTVSLTVWRAGKIRRVSVVLGHTE
jgi:S1-C subfamily serine protease